MILVCAAGNYVDPVVPPARLPETIAVAGVTWQSLPWHGSSFGPEVDFSAPAAAIYRPDAVPQGIGTQFKDGGDGTSYAAAITTGSAALWLRCWGPQIEAKYGGNANRVEAFRQAAIASCRKPPQAAGLAAPAFWCRHHRHGPPVYRGRDGAAVNLLMQF